jgi:hypothetical protein
MRKEGLGMSLRQLALPLTAAMAVACLALAAPSAYSATSAMKACNDEWNAEKANNTTNGAKYQDFLKQCLSKAGSTGTTTTAPATTTTTAPAPTTTTTTQAPAGTMTTATADPTAAAKKDCGKQWTKYKKDNPTATDKRKDWVAACVVKETGGTMPTTSATTTTTTMPKPATTTTMPKPAATTAPATTTASVEPTPPDPTLPAPATTTTDNKKPKTPGQIAMDVRIKKCGQMWKEAKANNTTNGLKWPQYWSQCNKQLKAQGM